ncbi:MAG TPA: YihY/virulence factor BrkB family protein [Solimonas sp.]|nr:YihY/virulence factor BrkB family protein [Solimonas sp.]
MNAPADAPTAAPRAPPAPRPAGFWKALFKDIGDDSVSSLAASIAYYATLSLAPLILLSLAVIGALYPSAQQQFVTEIGNLVGPKGAEVVKTIVESTDQRPDLQKLAGWSGVALLLFGASTVFAQLQDALNRIWNLRALQRPGAWGFVRRRVLSAGVLMGLLFLTIVSFVVQAGLSAFGGSEELLAKVLWAALSLLLYSCLFTALYRWLPAARLPWGTVIRGGVLTTGLFLLGRCAIGVYLARTDAAGAFGAAGAVVIWLIWAYYSALVFLLSAEVMYALAHARGWTWVADSPDVRPGVEA